GVSRGTLGRTAAAGRFGARVRPRPTADCVRRADLGVGCRDGTAGDGASGCARRPSRPCHNCCDARQSRLLVCRQDCAHGGRPYCQCYVRTQGAGAAMKRWFIPLIALVALAFTTTKAYEWRWRRESSPPPADPAQVTFTNTVAAVGLVEPSSENIAISTPV